MRRKHFAEPFLKIALMVELCFQKLSPDGLLYDGWHGCNAILVAFAAAHDDLIV
jgi:hypothetical protein